MELLDSEKNSKKTRFVKLMK